MIKIPLSPFLRRENLLDSSISLLSIKDATPSPYFFSVIFLSYFMTLPFSIILFLLLSFFDSVFFIQRNLSTCFWELRRNFHCVILMV
jgi:hypothetical protein